MKKKEHSCKTCLHKTRMFNTFTRESGYRCPHYSDYQSVRVRTDVIENPKYNCEHYFGVGK